MGATTLLVILAVKTRPQGFQELVHAVQSAIAKSVFAF